MTRVTVARQSNTLGFGAKSKTKMEPNNEQIRKFIYLYFFLDKRSFSGKRALGEFEHMNRERIWNMIVPYGGTQFIRIKPC